MAGCIWLVPETGTDVRADPGADPLCRCCRLTRTRPSGTDQGALARLGRRRGGQAAAGLQLLDLGPPVDSYLVRPGGLAYDLLSSNGTAVITGHQDGTRPGTTTGTSWVERAGRTEGFRGLFGDERADYGEALERHYAQSAPFETVLADWLPLTYALNAVNRSMGRDDLYPFVLSPAVVAKLTWVHHTILGEPEVAAP